MLARHIALAITAIGVMTPLLIGQGTSITYLKAGEPRTITVELLDESLTELKYRQGRGERTLSTTDLVDIQYGPGSDSLEQGKAALESQNLDKAVAQFLLASQDTDPPWVAPHALLMQADASLRQGEKGVAVAMAAVDDFIKRFPTHRLLPRAWIIRISLSSSLPEADMAVAEVARLADDDQIAPQWRVEALLAKGNHLLDQEDLTEAAEAFKAAERAAADGERDVGDRVDYIPVLKALGLKARNGTGTCLLSSGDLSAARSFYQQLLQDGAKHAELAIAAQNGLAACDFRDGGRLEEAQLGFAQVYLTGARVPEEHARSMYYLGRCAESLAEAGTDSTGRQKAAAYFDELKHRYPDTRWARLAQEHSP
ncbi:MAG: hypothetical protein VX916_03550 [Planctomycetota bacterium]|nr:hypothetical protein [Planctomycetota bacterium]